MQCKTAVVSGGSGGIGGAVAEALCRAGFGVVITFNNNRSAAETLCRRLSSDGLSIEAVRCDVSDEDEVNTVFSSLDAGVLVNCAGSAMHGLFQDSGDAGRREVFASNVFGMMNMTAAVLPSMLRRHEGCIVNISSVWGEYPASCEAVYSAAKGAVNAFTRSLADELGPSEIRVNAVAPGNIITSMTAPLGEEVLSDIAASTPLGRNGRPEDVARAVMWLVSESAAFVTGQVITVNGGWRG